MARPRKTRELIVWMNGRAVGAWTLGPRGTHMFAYADDWLAWPQARPLSLSLPLRPAAAPYRDSVVEAFFDNLLPDSRRIRERIQSRFRLASTRAFDLLAEIGRDCVGAVQLLPTGTVPEGWNQLRGERLDEAGVAAILRNTPTLVGDAADTFRISLAGAQEKTALLWHDGAWHRPLGATPTTHILKLPLGRIGREQIDMTASIENEWLCAQIVRAYGLPVADCRMATFEDQRALVVTRFDRRLATDGSHLLRLPQEDLCQALGAPPSLKYESDGGPGIEGIMDLLLGSTQAEQDRRNFFKAQVLFWMLCATDGHAKNFSIALGPRGRYQSTPLYDVISAWPVIGHGANQWAPEHARMAMAAVSHNRHYRWNDIQPRHWLSTAHACGLDPDTAADIMRNLVHVAPTVVTRVRDALPAGFPERTAEAIFVGVRTAAAKLEAGVAA